MKKDVAAIITELTINLLQKIEVEAQVATSETDEVYLVKIDAPSEGGILIGRHGRSLEAIQTLLGQMVFKTTGEWHRIVVSVGDYRERRDEQLRQLALESAQKVVSSGEAVVLADLSPIERRTVHVALTDHPDVVSESEGEGRERRLVIKPKSS